MSYFTKSVTVFGLWLGLFANPASAAPASETDMAALRALATTLDRAWDAGDADAMASFYVDDGTLTMFPRTGVAGREGIRAYFARSFARRPAGMRHVTRLGEIDLIAPDIAVVDGYVRLEKVASDGGTTLVRSFVSHSILVRQDGTWLVRLVRTHVKPNTDVDTKFTS